MSKTSYDDWGMTDEKLRKRLIKVERGSICNQTLIVFVVSAGSFIFGNIIAWGEPALKHVSEFISEQSHVDEHFTWLLSFSPLVAGGSLLIWAFIKERIGSKNTILLQTPLLLVGWALKGYFNTIEYYKTGHVITSFFSISYLYAGSALVTECVHRNNIKLYYTIFRTSHMLGIFWMDIISTIVDRFWLCHICASISLIVFILLWFLPDSPVYYAKRGRMTQAENSLKFYMGKQSISNEINVIRQYVFLLGTGNSAQHMFSKKVVLKAIFILFCLQVVRVMSGFYALILNSVVIFRKEKNYMVNQYWDNIFCGSTLFLSRLILCYLTIINIGKIRVKVLLLLSSIFMCLGLFSLAFNLHYEMEWTKKWLTQTSLCCISIAYHIGLDIVPDILTYEYLPYQIYNFMVKVMYITHWIMVAGVIRLYLWLQKSYDTYVALFILAGFTAVGVLFIAIFVVETKEKSLTNIQMELGANPVGSRGSRRQRIGNPYERNEGANYLNNLIAEHTESDLKTPEGSRKQEQKQSNGNDKNQKFPKQKPTL